MAVTLIEDNGHKLFEVHVSGKLTRKDYQRIGPLFERLIVRHGKIRVLFGMSQFRGWEAAALWDDLKLDLKHFKDIERLAMVGEMKWQKWMAAFCRPFTAAAVRYFEHAQADTARDWLIAR